MKLICVGDSPKNTDGRPCRTLNEAVENGKISLRISGKEGLLNTLKKTNNDIIVIQQANANPSLLRSIRSGRISLPILVISRNMSDRDISDTLDAGADDYVDITISPLQLLARLNALIRRSSNKILSGNKIILGRMVINENEKEVFIDDNLVILTRNEFAVFSMIAKKKGNIVSKESIFNHIYIGREKPHEKIIDVLIHNIRKKIEKRGIKNPFITSRNLGYYINNDAFTNIGARKDDMYVTDNSIESSMPVSSSSSITTSIVK